MDGWTDGRMGADADEDEDEDDDGGSGPGDKTCSSLLGGTLLDI